MSSLKDATNALRDLEALLRTSPQEGLDPVAIAEQVREVRRLLSDEDARWIGTTQAKQLLGLGSENTVKAWARLGLLESRKRPNGRIQVLLDDVLRRRTENEALLAIDGKDLSSDEHQILKEERPGKTHGSEARLSNQSDPAVAAAYRGT